MMSLTEVQRAARVLETRLAGSMLQRVIEPDDFHLALEFYGRSGTNLIHLSCHPRFARVGALESIPKAPPVVPAFAQYLRAHLGRAACAGIRAQEHDRRLEFSLRNQERGFVLILSIMGSRSNFYLLDQDQVLLFAARSLESTRRGLVLGEPWTEPDGAPRSPGEDRWHGTADDHYLESIEATYASLEMGEQAEALARRLEQACDRQSASLERKAVNLLQDLAEAVRAEEFRHKGELLKLALGSIGQGDESVTVEDYEAGAAVEIALDPQLSPVENLTAYFKRYQKELRGAKALRRQLELVRSSQEDLAGLRQRLTVQAQPPAAALASLQAISLEPVARKLLLRHAPESRAHAQRPTLVAGRAREIPARLRPKRYRTETGLEIWVGRNDEGNDYLTTRLARGNDLFFHLEGFPGSHVVLRTEGRADPPSPSLLDACELAVHFSKMKNARQADVHVAQIKDVKKPKGAKPGLVYVTRGKTIHLRRDARRLENILASRLDE